jgi:hypothetical protein
MSLLLCARLVYQKISVWRVVCEGTFDDFALCLHAGTGFTHIAQRSTCLVTDMKVISRIDTYFWR